MLFNSLAFIIFFPVVTIGYFLLPHRLRWLWLLLASCYFYMFFRPVYILILFFTIAVDYAAGILIENSENPKKRKAWLIASLVANIGVLALFKYYNFLNDNLSVLLGLTGTKPFFPSLEILLPVGLSFHTFQAMSYTLEVYKGKQRAERHAGIYALYVMFYPQLVAGPIERPQHLLHQFREPHQYDYERISKGLRRMAWGFFKKLVIADRLSVYVDVVFDNPHQYSGWPLIFATLLFSIQIYCDFSGYCDIALGSSRVMGFRLVENFNFPYFSASFREFWTRWHISLSSWFRDYVYIPLGGNRNGRRNFIFNIVIAFSLSGLWHGAAWTFVLWGLLHGFYVILERLTGFGKAGRNPFAVLITFLGVSFAWIFFRAHSLHDAVYIVTHLWPDREGLIGVPTISAFSFVLNGILVLLVMSIDGAVFSGWNAKVAAYFPSQRMYHYTVNAMLLLFILLFGIFEEQTFIYFQF